VGISHIETTEIRTCMLVHISTADFNLNQIRSEDTEIWKLSICLCLCTSCL